MVATNGHKPGAPLSDAELLEEEPSLQAGLLTTEGYEDMNRFAEDILLGGQPKSLEEYVEIHQRRVSPAQRKVLAYLLASRSPRLRDYARTWLSLAGQETGANDFLLLAKYRSLEVPLEQRSINFNPGN